MVEKKSMDHLYILGLLFLSFTNGTNGAAAFRSASASGVPFGGSSSDKVEIGQWIGQNSSPGIGRSRSGDEEASVKRKIFEHVINSGLKKLHAYFIKNGDLESPFKAHTGAAAGPPAYQEPHPAPAGAFWRPAPTSSSFPSFADVPVVLTLPKIPNKPRVPTSPKIPHKTDASFSQIEPTPSSFLDRETRFETTTTTEADADVFSLKNEQTLEGENRGEENSSIPSVAIPLIPKQGYQPPIPQQGYSSAKRFWDELPAEFQRRLLADYQRKLEELKTIKEAK